MNINPLDILESVPVGIIVTDLDGNIKTINRYAKSCIDMADDSFENQDIPELSKNRPASPLSDFLSIRDRRENVFHTVKKNGRIFELSIAPLNGPDGEPTGSVIIMKDRTDVEKDRELALRKERYAALEEFSADIAHEIRNPLGSIELYASLLKKELKRKKDVNRINQIIAAAKIVENKISSLILLSKNFDMPTKPVNIHTILKDILLFSEQIIDDETIFLSVKYAEIEPIVDCNPDMVKQVLLNLILNALQTIPEKSRLDIVTKHQPENDTIDIYFIDNGPGNPDNMPFKILERFSRINEKSSHLGLAIVHNIISMYKGSLKIECIEGTGTAFILSFPLIDMSSTGDSH